MNVWPNSSGFLMTVLKTLWVIATNPVVITFPRKIVELCNSFRLDKFLIEEH